MFQFGGLVVAGDLADVDLPKAGGDPDIVVRRACVPVGDGTPIQRWNDTAGRAWLAIERAGGAYRVLMPELASLVTADGGAVTYEPANGADAGTVKHLLLHHVLPFALSRHGRLVLHACAVEMDGTAIGFIGRSGSGKSTLAAACCRRGYRLVADDALALTIDDGRPVAWPTADGVRLWPNEAAGGSKQRVAVPVAPGPVPLARLYMIGTSYAAAYVDRVEPAVARLELIQQVVRLDPTVAEESQRIFEAIHTLLDAVPMRWIMYPNGPGHLDAAVEALARDSISA